MFIKCAKGANIFVYYMKTTKPILACTHNTSFHHNNALNYNSDTKYKTWNKHNEINVNSHSKLHTFKSNTRIVKTNTALVPYSKHLSTISFTKSTMEAAPPSWKPYLKLIRWDRPIGSWLLFLPCTWSICLAADSLNQFPPVSTLALFGLGAVVMRGAGCTINDMWDKDFDKMVERTRDRPIACGDITQKQALAFLALQLSVGLGVLLSFDWSTIILGASSMALIITYPLMKRITYWPQLFLGGVFNWGAMLGWSATTGGAVAWPAVIPLYAAGIAWTLTYDTIYGHQDKEDDQLIGVKSTALRFGDNSKLWLSGFSTLMCGGLLTTGVLCDQAWPYYAGVGIVSSHLVYQLYTVNLNNPDDCSKTFRSNRNLGIILWISILLSSAVKYNDRRKQKEVENVEGKHVELSS